MWTFIRTQGHHVLPNLKGFMWSRVQRRTETEESRIGVTVVTRGVVVPVTGPKEVEGEVLNRPGHRGRNLL